MIQNSRNIQGYLLPKLSEPSLESMDIMSARRLEITVKPIRKPKRFRSAFSTEQIESLEQQFKKYPYISCEHRKEIASALKLEERAIKIWFQNRRMKEKKDKETDYEITSNVDGQDRLIRTCTLSSTNDHISYSLPALVKQVYDKNVANTSFKVNTVKNIQEIVSPLVHNLSTKHTKGFKNLNQNKNIIKHSSLAESYTKYGLKQTEKAKKKLPTKVESVFFADKKTRKPSQHITQVDAKHKIPKNVVPKANITPSPQDLSNKTLNSPAMSNQKQPEVSIPYYSMMPSVYSHPYISSGGMIWKPVVMPVMPAGSNGDLLHGAVRKPCNCNCHNNASVFAQPSNSYNPYGPYVPPTFSSPKY